VINDIILAVVQAATEFLPVSSSGHLALVSNIISEPDLFFFTALHIASLVAVIIFTRKEIYHLIKFREEHRKLWLYLGIATIPAAIFGFFFRGTIEKAFSSYLSMGIAFLLTGIVLLLTKYSTRHSTSLNSKNSFLIGMAQVLGLFPGVSRSGITITTGLLMGLNRVKAAKFSFLLFIPLSLGAFVLGADDGFYFDLSLAVAFIVCMVLSLVFLNLIFVLIRHGKFWLFSIYCFFMGALTLTLYFLNLSRI